MSILETIDGPADLRAVEPDDLPRLAAEIRDFLVTHVCRNGGHLGPNLGVVELTIALHRVFDSPQDRIVFDTGHQSYVHKVLTGRRDRFATLRRAGGLSGYPSRAESAHDIVENSHASTALSYAAGLARAYQMQGVTDRSVVAVIGDGALTGGMAWEAMNNIASAEDLPLVIVINDNGRSYAPTIGGLARHLGTLRTSQGYERFLGLVKESLPRLPGGGALYDTLHGVKKGIKDIVAPQGMFEDLGLKYVGPIDGHDEAAVETALRQARGFGSAVIVHCVTVKGRDYAPAENDDLDCFHAVRTSDPVTGRPIGSSGPSWTSVFSDTLVGLGRRRPDVVAITAAMLEPAGLAEFRQVYPDRVFDVGIAEQHAVTFAAGLSMGALHPVVAIYATFLNRAFDQVLMDAALHRCPITLVLDRAGVTGDDGPSHNGMWDMSILQVVPGLRLAAPRDGRRLRELLSEAVAVEDGPTVVRYPKGAVPPDLPAEAVVAGMDVLSRDEEEDILLVSVGAVAGLCLDVAGLVRQHGYGVTVVDPRWVKPVNPALPTLAARHALVATVEDNGRVGGVGSAIAQALSDSDVDTPVRVFGLPQEFLDHGRRDEVLERGGLTVQGVARAMVEAIARQRSERQPALRES